MSPKTIKLIAFILLLIHGIGHLQGVIASFGVKINNANATHSWLITDQNMSKVICIILFVLTAITGITAALSLMELIIPHYLWQNLALVSAVLSTACLIIFPDGFAMFFNKVGAVVVNIIIYYSILFHQKWPSVLFED